MQDQANYIFPPQESLHVFEVVVREVAHESGVDRDTENGRVLERMKLSTCS